MSLLHHDEPLVDERPLWTDEQVAAGRIEPAARETVVVRKNSAGQTIRTILATLVAAAVVAVAALNTGDLDLDFGFTNATYPLWGVIGAAGFAGLVAGWLYGRRPRAAAISEQLS
jgi:uncharacterized integral membrane protein